MADELLAIYVRVSLKDLSQDPMNQSVPLHNLAKALGGQVVEEYVDYGSGGNGDRKNFLRMLADAERGKFKKLLVWSLDRFSREGINNCLGYLERLRRAGVTLRSLQESWLNTDDKGVGNLLIAIFSWVAAQERQRIIERTRAGLERVKREGRRLGRPVGSKDKCQRKRSGYWLRYAKQAA